MNTVCVDLQALCRNYLAVQAIIGDSCRLMAVVKADGYGHGMLEAALVLQKVGVSCFGVGTAGEGRCLRQNGINGQIVVLLGGCERDVELLVQYRLEPVVSDYVQLAYLQRVVQTALPVHVKVDCGMGRLGFSPQEMIQVCTKIRESSLVIAGVMSHFPVADEDVELSRKQAELFARTVEDLRGSGVEFTAHMANSAAVFGGLAFYEMVRVGLALYGCLPLMAPQFGQTSLEPVMTVKSRVLQVKQVPAGTGISYGLTQQTRRDSRLAVIGIGYADGFPRLLSGCGQVLVGGSRAQIIGRVCMNMTVVDVTDIDAVECGAEVVVLGRQGEDEISAAEIAEWAGTINYEILCSLGNLNSRVYV
jgi:alanine racemase